MSIYKSLSEFISERKLESNSSFLGESNVGGQFEKAVEKLADFISKKTGKKFLKVPGIENFTADSLNNSGVCFYTEKGEKLRISQVQSKPGLIHLIDYWSNPSSKTSFSSDNFSIVNLAYLIADFIKNPASVKALSEEYIGEARVTSITPDQKNLIEKLLSQGETMKNITLKAKVPYSMVLKVKNGVAEVVKPSKGEISNQATLEDKLKYFNIIMEDIYDLTTAIALKKAKSFTGLFITGRAGTGKTFTVNRALETLGYEDGYNFTTITGAVSTINMYKTLYQYNDKIIIFDDADSVFADENSRNILKAALDIKPRRKISYKKNLKMLYDPKDFEGNDEGEARAIEQGLIPNEFVFTGNVIFISNLSKDKADPDGAIRSRSLLVNLDPDDETLMKRIEMLLPHLDPKELSLAEKKEVFEFIKDSGSPSMRTFVKACGFKIAGLKNWKRMAEMYV